MKKRTLFVIAVLSCILIFTGLLYWQQSSTNSTMYISLTATSENGECHFYVYDIPSQNLTEIYKIPDTTQYPLGVVDKQQSNVYFTYRINHGDQLMRYDLRTKQVLQLTEDIYAVNQILPVGEKVYLIASTFTHPRLGLIEYDLTTSTYEILTPNTDVVMQMTYDKQNSNIIFASYDWAEQKKLQYEYEHKNGKKQSIAENAKYEIHNYDIITENITELVQTNEVIAAMDINNTGDTLLLRVANSLFEPRQNIFFSLKEKKFLDTIPVEQVKRLECIALAPDNAGIYFTGSLPSNVEDEYSSHPNALIYMDFSKGKCERIISFEDKYINNFWICK